VNTVKEYDRRALAQAYVDAHPANEIRYRSAEHEAHLGTTASTRPCSTSGWRRRARVFTSADLRAHGVDDTPLNLEDYPIDWDSF
jgi:hypothetical protein